MIVRINLDFRKVVLFLFVLAFFVTSERAGFFQAEGSNFHIHHVIFVGLVVAFIYTRSFTIPSKWVMLFMVYATLTAVANKGTYGINGLYVTILYDVAIIIILSNVLADYSYEELIFVFRAVWVAAFILIALNDITQMNIIVAWLRNPRFHPGIETLNLGGVNIEATMLGCFSLFWVHSRRGWIPLTLSFFVSALYASRAGMVVDAVVLLYYILKVQRLDFKQVFGGVFFMIVAFLMLSNIEGLDYVMDRLFAIGSDGDSLARVTMVREGIETFKRNPFGVGAGNAMSDILSHGGSHVVSNVHNIYIQYLADEGFIGFIFILGGSVWVIRKAIRERFDNLFTVFLLIYLIEGLFQSRGVDSWAAVVLGVVYALQYRQNFEYGVQEVVE